MRCCHHTTRAALLASRSFGLPVAALNRQLTLDEGGERMDRKECKGRDGWAKARQEAGEGTGGGDWNPLALGKAFRGKTEIEIDKLILIDNL